MLSCSCNDEYEYFYVPGDDFATLREYGYKRRKRCHSCHKVIDVSEDVLPFHRDRTDENGDEIPLAPKFMCERCAGLFFALDELGFCITLGDDMRELIKEYQEYRKIYITERRERA